MRVAGESPGDDGSGVGVEEVEEEEKGTETDDRRASNDESRFLALGGCE